MSRELFYWGVGGGRQKAVKNKIFCCWWEWGWGDDGRLVQGSDIQGISFGILFLTKQLQKYILMTCHCPKAYETSCENIASQSQTSCLPSPGSSFFYTDDWEPKLWLGLPQAAQLRATFSWTCEDNYDVTTIDPANKIFLFTYIFGFKCCVEWTWLWIMFLAFSAPMSELAWTSTWQTLTDFPKVLITRKKK